MVSRREFLKKSGQAALAVGGGLTLDALFSSCATIRFKEESPVIYPPLKGHKLQPPEHGCLIGIRRAVYGGENFGSAIDTFEKEFSTKPAIFAVQGRFSLEVFPWVAALGLVERGVIPALFPQLGNLAFKDLAKGKANGSLANFANDARYFGERYGGFFMVPMIEMNIERKYDIWPWAGRPRLFKKAWEYIWEVFEDHGANDYVTWILEYHVDHPLSGYYPNPKTVDYIGLSAYNRKVHEQYYGYRYLDDLIDWPYKYFKTKYPDKPIIQAEFGTTIGKDQPAWIRKAYETIKSKPGLKAAIYFDNVCTHVIYDDHTLSDESKKVAKEVFKDPYFIGSTDKG